MIHSKRLWRVCLAAVGGVALALTAGLLSHTQILTPRPTAGPLIAQTVPLDPAHPERLQLSALTYAGGLMLSAGSSTAFGGLSGIAVFPGVGGATVTGVTDEGAAIRFTAQLDPGGRLVGARDLTLLTLRERGNDLGRDKAHGDAEDIALTDGGTYVSFEVDNRVLFMSDPFEAGGGGRRLALPAAVLALPRGEGLEALAAAEIGDQPILALGSEDGRVWLCPRQADAPPDCPLILTRPPEAAFRLTALAALAGSEDFIALYRALDPLRGWRARIEWVSKTPVGYTSRNLAQLAAPMTVDNMEGLAVSPLPGGDWRLYLVSDDNFRDDERTLLLAFDWRRP